MCFNIILLLVSFYLLTLPRVNRPARDDHPPQASAEVEERVELSLYSFFGPS